jgi:hypothetical protein
MVIIAEEVVQHLSRFTGFKVEITLEIQADISAGVPENLVRKPALGIIFEEARREGASRSM